MGESLKQLKAINIVYRSNSFGIKRMSDLDRRRRILSRQLVLDSPSSVLQHAHLAVCSGCLFKSQGRYRRWKVAKALKTALAWLR